MVKRRQPASARREVTEEEIEAFVSGAEEDSAKVVKLNEPDPNAKRTFKSIRVPFNEYEYLKLEEAAAKTGRTKLNYLRWSMLKVAEEVQ